MVDDPIVPQIAWQTLPAITCLTTDLSSAKLHPPREALGSTTRHLADELLVTHSFMKFVHIVAVV